MAATGVDFGRGAAGIDRVLRRTGGRGVRRMLLGWCSSSSVEAIIVDSAADTAEEDGASVDFVKVANLLEKKNLEFIFDSTRNFYCRNLLTQYNIISTKVIFVTVSLSPNWKRLSKL